MAIEKTVIRYLPYDTGDYGGNIGVRRSPPPGTYGKATAAFPGNEAFANVASVWDGSSGTSGYFSSVDTGWAGIVGPVREFEFILLAEDGVTLAPLEQGESIIYVGVGGDNVAVYGGGIIEIGAYYDGQYFDLGYAELGTPWDWSGPVQWNYDGIYEVFLGWPDPPAAPPFWTALKNSVETV